MQILKSASGLKLLCGLLGVLLIVFYLPILSRQQDYYQSDLTYYFEPFSNFISNCYRHFKLPAWNPYLYCGMSQVAVPSPGMFYPGILLFVLMPFSQALAAFMVLHQTLAGVGAYLLIFSMGWGAAAAMVAGAAIALCGYMFALQFNYTLVATACWIPLLFYSVRSIGGRVNRANVLRMARAAFCMSMMVTAGRPEISIPAALLVVAYMLVSVVATYSQDRVARPVIQTFSWRCISLACGVILAMPVLLPAMEWVKLSPRQHGLELVWVLMWSANWYDCLGLVLGQPLGDLTFLGNKFLNMAASRPNAVPYLTSTYLGPVVFTLAFWGLADPRWKWKWLVLAFFAGGITMALGSATPVAPFVAKLTPMFSSFRYPVKMMIFPIMAVIVLAARGTMLAMNRQVPRVGQITSAVIWILVLMTAGLFYADKHLSHVLNSFPWTREPVTNFADMLQAQHAFGRSLLVAGGLGLLTCANYWLYLTKRLTSNLFAGLIVFTTCMTLIAPAMSFARKGTVPDFYSRPDRLAQDMRTATKGEGAQRFASRVLALAFDPLTPGTTFLKDENIDFQRGFYLFARQLMLPNVNLDFGVPYAFGYEAAEVGQYKTLFSTALAMSSQNRAHLKESFGSDAPMARFAQLTSTSRVFTQSFQHVPTNTVPMLDDRFFTLLKDDQRFNVRVFATKTFFPRAYFANNIKWNPTWQRFFDEVENNESEAMLSDTQVWGKPDLTVQDHKRADRSEEIQFVRDEDEYVSLRAKPNARRLLVLTDQWYPGWQVYIDGKPAPLRRVNFFARGVVVDPGLHVVEFRYRPRSLAVGFACTLLTVLFFLAAYLFVPPRRRTMAAS